MVGFKLCNYVNFTAIPLTKMNRTWTSEGLFITLQQTCVFFLIEKVEYKNKLNGKFYFDNSLIEEWTKLF